MAQGLVTAGQEPTPTLFNRVWGLGDGTAHTVVATTFTDLSTAKTIAAGSLQAQTAYKVTAWGHGTWGSTQQALTLAAAIAGTAGNSVAVASTALAANAAFDWRAECLVLCTASGSSGTFSTSLKGILNETANALLPGTAADATAGFTRSQASVSADTTTALTVSLQVKWASATGAPTITCDGTLWQKISQEVS